VGKKCELFLCCPLRIFYEGLGNDEWVKKYCRGKFRECARYKLEIMGGRKAVKKPSSRKRAGNF